MSASLQKFNSSLDKTEVIQSKRRKLDETQVHLDESGVPRKGCCASRLRASRSLPLIHPSPTAIGHDREAIAGKFYSPLNKWQTRILCIKPGWLGQPLITELSKADLICFEGVGITEANRIVQYKAVSYSWGYLGFSHTVRCNGHDFPVTRSQWEALQYSRDSEKEVYVWVDAICINQFDNVEKNVQIGHMFQIFKKAALVVVWLGEKDVCGARAVEHLYQYDQSEHAPPMPECKECLNDLYQDLQKLSKRPWFRRTWVRQEVYAARDLVAQCGDCKISWESFRGGISWLLRELQMQKICMTDLFPTINLLPCVPVPTQTDPDSSDDDEDGKENLANALSSSSLFEATDPRDIVYGILGLTNTKTSIEDIPESPQSGKRVLHVDYRKSISHVYQDAARYLVDQHGLDAILLPISRRRNDLQLPSWTPDWRDWPKFALKDQLYDFVSGADVRYVRQFFKTDAYRRETKTQWHVPNPDELGILKVRGVACGRLLVYPSSARLDCSPSFLSSLDWLFYHPDVFKATSAVLEDARDSSDKDSFSFPYQLIRSSTVFANDALVLRDQKLTCPFEVPTFGAGEVRRVDELLPKGTLTGDRLVMLQSASHPVVLRSFSNGRHKLVGVADLGWYHQKTPSSEGTTPLVHLWADVVGVQAFFHCYQGRLQEFVIV